MRAGGGMGAVARMLMDKGSSNAAREAAINANPQFAADLIREMTKDLGAGSAAERERIPWIWRVAISCGKRNDAGQIRSVLGVSLPENEQPLREWQPVVVGGGIINGMSQRGAWPGERMGEIVGTDAAMKKRWERALELAAGMADSESVVKGTRYDALRMLEARSWEVSGEQLVKYLGKAVDGELQIGAVSGVSDVRAPEAAEVLIGAMGGLTEGNRALAMDGLLRDAGRANALLDAVEGKKIGLDSLGKERVEKLKGFGDAGVRKRAGVVLKSLG